MAAWYRSQTFPSWSIPLLVGDGTTDSDSIAEDLTGVDINKFTMIFRTGTTDTVGTGTFTIKRYYPAEVFYKPSPADVAATFSGTLIIKALFPPSQTTADQVIYDPIPFTIIDY
jgi:hypothetical protein